MGSLSWSGTSPASGASGETPGRLAVCPRLEARGIAKYYDHFVALDGIDLVFEAGEFVVVLGRNGAGKTTLLRVLGLIVKPSAGELRFDGRPLSDCSPALKARVGFVGHESFLYDELTIGENLRFYARLYGLVDGTRAIESRLEELGLADRAGELVRNLSRGLRQRVAIARALLHEPDLLLLDEPATGLDAPTSERFYALLARLHAAGHSVVLSSHEFTHSLSLASRVVLLERGQVIFNGQNSPEARAVVAGRLGSAGA
ncbi:MAG: heme ABC exporter ATP-binding protein CcmA [Terriglobia bacterium]